MCKMPDGGIWIATNDNDVLHYKKVDTVINAGNGLTSNICKSLIVKDHYLWVGTDKGINKIDVITKKVLTNTAFHTDLLQMSSMRFTLKIILYGFALRLVQLISTKKIFPAIPAGSAFCGECDLAWQTKQTGRIRFYKNKF